MGGKSAAGLMLKCSIYIIRKMSNFKKANIWPRLLKFKNQDRKIFLS